MSNAASTEYASAYPGSTKITKTALNRVLAAVAAEAFALEPGQIKVETRDDRGLLGLQLTVPLVTPPLIQLASDAQAAQDVDLNARARRARAEVVRKGSEITGSTLGRVDIVISGAEITEPPRVS
ncbi:hypothetical protein ODZ83_08495 [Acaricomes phytoseiuli]|uniref:hypothetical protein n=1 Tax=Acaricomes phytoseiuli TaxID=291968 RepID=UPI00036DC424|nr:hypothetical protein [Acaricomes phytoseiuli]MCW1250214.1 hypothetical protein [Acaricomes phytoseiuli]